MYVSVDFSVQVIVLQSGRVELEQITVFPMASVAALAS